MPPSARQPSPTSLPGIRERNTDDARDEGKGLQRDWSRSLPSRLHSMSSLTHTQNDFIVHDTDNTPVLRCSAKGWSIRNRRGWLDMVHPLWHWLTTGAAAIYDMTGGALFSMRTKLMAWLFKQIIEDPQGNELFSATQRIARACQMDTGAGADAGQSRPRSGPTLWMRALDRRSASPSSEVRLGTVPKSCWMMDRLSLSFRGTSGVLRRDSCVISRR